MRLFDAIPPLEQIEIPLTLRASLMQTNEIKFLIRYEIEDEPNNLEDQQPDLSSSKMSKYRFTRVLFNIESQFSFMLKKHVHLSTKKANEHIVNI